MVFKKPYAFLIKHFKLIHLILTGLYIFLAFRVNSILGYYNGFIVGTANRLDAIKYVNQYHVVAVVISIIICLIVYALMRYKKKPRMLYLILIAFSLLIAFIIQVVSQGLQTIYISILETKTLRLYRDILQILIWFQYVSIGVVLVRGLGFDVKKFNFVQDLEDLGIDVSDEEEVELTLGSTNTLQRKIHRGFREFKYYYLENKIFINVLAVVIVLLVLSTFVVHHEVIAKDYQQNEIFSSEQFQFQVLNSFITNKDYNNQEITSKGSTFLIARIQIASKSGSRELNTSKLILKIGANKYAPMERMASKFVDLGTTYRGYEISGSAIYLFVYNIDKADIGKEYKIVYDEDKTVYLDPVNLDEISQTTNYKLNETIDLSHSNVGNGSFQITAYEIQEKFAYSYEYEIMGEMSTGTLQIVSNQNVILNLKIKSSYSYYFTDYILLSENAKLKYKVDGVEYTSSVLLNKTPNTYKEGLYLAVDKNIEKATEIWFDIKVRNQEYIYTLR